MKLWPEKAGHHAVVCQPMHNHLLPVGFSKQPIPPYTVSTYQELFHCMNTAFVVEADSQTCTGVHFNTAHCCLVNFSTPRPYLLPPPPNSFTVYLSQPLPSLSFLSPLLQNHFFFLPSPSLSLRAQRRFMAGYQSGEAI